jgi:hypothetical protein
MNQTGILKELIIRYQLSGGDVSDIGSIVVYVTATKPPGVGRVNEVIIRAMLKQMGDVCAQPAASITQLQPPKTPMLEAPPAIIESVETFEPVVNYDFGEPLMPPVRIEALITTSQPLPAPEKPHQTPESNPVEVAPTAQAPKGFWNKIKAKWWK